MIEIKSRSDIKKMREAGKILADTFDVLYKHAKVGVSASFLDKLAYENITRYGADPSFLGYQGFKHSTCISKNEEVVHGIPYEDKLLLPGDICTIDCGVYFNGFHADAARIFVMDELDPKVQKLVDVTTNSFFQAIPYLKSGNKLGQLSSAMQTYIESFDMAVVTDLYSHGIGRKLHEDPLIPHYGSPSSGVTLKEGMVFAIEPMVNLGSSEVLTLDDKWTIITVDHQWSAHYENTVLVTDNGPEILTIH